MSVYSPYFTFAWHLLLYWISAWIPWKQNPKWGLRRKETVWGATKWRACERVLNKVGTWATGTWVHWDILKTHEIFSPRCSACLWKMALSPTQTALVCGMSFTRLGEGPEQAFLLFTYRSWKAYLKTGLQTWKEREFRGTCHLDLKVKLELGWWEVW